MKLDRDLHNAILRAAGDHFLKTFQFTQSIKLTTTLTVLVDCDRQYVYTDSDVIKSADTWFNHDESVRREQVPEPAFDLGIDDAEDTIDYDEADDSLFNEEKTTDGHTNASVNADIDDKIKLPLVVSKTDPTEKFDKPYLDEGQEDAGGSSTDVDKDNATLPTLILDGFDNAPTTRKGANRKSKKGQKKKTSKKKKGLKSIGNVDEESEKKEKTYTREKEEIDDDKSGLMIKKVESLKIKIKPSEISSEGYECDICGSKYKTKSSYNRHIMNHNQMLERYQCEQCEKSFKRLESLHHHQRAIHEEEKVFKCTEEGCDASFNFHHSLKLHKLKHSGDRPYKCSHCSKTYLTAYHLKVHINGAHTEAKEYTCKVCGKSFCYSNSLKVHEATHDGFKVREQCDQCEKTFVNKQALRYHKMARHGETGHFPCDICKKVYRSELLLKSHRKCHTKANGRFMCDLCGRQYMYQSTLEMHKLVHRDEKSFQCKICHKAFKTGPTLYSHMFVHRQDSPFVCGTCNKAFKTKERLKAHSKRHAGLKPFECQLCKHRFPDKGGLTKHTKTVHCPQKKFTCNICGKTTTRADNLRVHMKIHAKGNIKPTMTVQDSSEGDMDNLPSTVPLVIDTGEDIQPKQGRKQRKPKASNKVQSVPVVAIQDITLENNESRNQASYQQNMPHFSTIDSSQISTSFHSTPKKFIKNQPESQVNGIPSHIANENLIVINTDSTEEESDGNNTTKSMVTMVPSTVTAGTISVTPMQPVSYLYTWPYICATGTQQTGNSQSLFQQ